MHDREALRDDILARCRELGFALAGVADAAPIGRADELRQWLRDEKHGEMTWLADTAPERLDPRRVLPGARGVIMVADLVKCRNEPPAAPEPGRGRVARYAQGRDYHRVIKKRLHRLCDDLRVAYPGSEYRAFVDSAPVMERDLALRAGLGWIGKHTLLIHPRLGSHVLLGGALTTLELPRPELVPDHCGACTRCIDACPTNAISPYSVNARRCISYLTIEHPGDIPPDLAHLSADWVVGCDICQDVCPHNSPRSPGIDVGTPRDDYAPKNPSFDLLDLLGWTEADRRRAAHTSPLKRVKLDQFRRNARIAAANDPTLDHEQTLSPADLQSPGGAHHPRAPRGHRTPRPRGGS